MQRWISVTPPQMVRVEEIDEYWTRDPDAGWVSAEEANEEIEKARSETVQREREEIENDLENHGLLLASRIVRSRGDMAKAISESGKKPCVHSEHPIVSLGSGYACGGCHNPISFIVETPMPTNNTGKIARLKYEDTSVSWLDKINELIDAENARR